MVKYEPFNFQRLFTLVESVIVEVVRERGALPSSVVLSAVSVLVVPSVLVTELETEEGAE
jgi:hypothetical protein